MNSVTQFLLVFSILGMVASAEQVGAFPAVSTTTPKQEKSNPTPPPDDEEWITITPTGARSSIQMPKKPRYVERSFSPIKDKPPIKVRLHLATVNEGLTTYIFGYHDLHEIPKTKKNVNDALDGAVRGSVANVLGQLLSSPTVIKYKTNLGRQFVYACSQQEKKYIVTSRVFVVGKRLYQISCLMEESVFSAPVAEKFLQSFRLIQIESDLPPRPRVSR